MIGFSWPGKLPVNGLVIAGQLLPNCRSVNLHQQYLFNLMCHQNSIRKRGHTASVCNQFSHNAELKGTSSTFFCLTTLNGIFGKSVFDIGGNLSNYPTSLAVLDLLNGIQHDKFNNVLLY